MTDTLKLWGLSITKEGSIIEIRFSPNDFIKKDVDFKHGYLHLEERKIKGFDRT